MLLMRVHEDEIGKDGNISAYYCSKINMARHTKCDLCYLEK